MRKSCLGICSSTWYIHIWFVHHWLILNYMDCSRLIFSTVFWPLLSDFPLPSFVLYFTTTSFQTPFCWASHLHWKHFSCRSSAHRRLGKPMLTAVVQPPAEDLGWTALQECFRSQMKLRAVKTSSSREEFWNATYCSTFCELDEREWRHIGSTEETCSPVKDCNHVQALPLWSGCAECSMVQWLYLRLNTPVSWLSFLEGRWSFNTSIRRGKHAGSFVPSAAGDTQENVRR